MKRVITFHNKLKTAEKFSQNIENTLKTISPSETNRIFSDYIDGGMSADKRRNKIDQLK